MSCVNEPGAVSNTTSDPPSTIRWVQPAVQTKKHPWLIHCTYGIIESDNNTVEPLNNGHLWEQCFGYYTEVHGLASELCWGGCFVHTPFIWDLYTWVPGRYIAVGLFRVPLYIVELLYNGRICFGHYKWWTLLRVVLYTNCSSLDLAFISHIVYI